MCVFVDDGLHALFPRLNLHESFMNNQPLTLDVVL
jgi:hypothetical protein